MILWLKNIPLKHSFLFFVVVVRLFVLKWLYDKNSDFLASVVPMCKALQISGRCVHNARGASSYNKLNILFASGWNWLHLLAVWCFSSFFFFFLNQAGILHYSSALVWGNICISHCRNGLRLFNPITYTLH